MTRTSLFGFTLMLLPCAVLTIAATPRCTIEDPAGALGQTEAPVSVTAKLSKSQLAAARIGRLGLMARKADALVPVQWESVESSAASLAVYLLPPGPAGQRQFTWRESKIPFAPVMQATPDTASGQIELSENGKPVLRYNYQTIEPGEVLDKVTPANRIYARPRSDYIHPLFGLKGEVLTRDWPIDHPHHRGIYWAWPEVDLGGERGDLHALQKVFARPTGRVHLQSGPVFAQIQAENQWLWEEREPIVREVAVIRAYRATARGRLIDLAFQFTALKDGVTLARRGTAHYGGLNVRMVTPKSQEISVHTDPSNAVPRRAWSDLSGLFSGTDAPSGLSILQYQQNPDYPGEWIQYPELSWCQPTFPAAGTRYALAPGKPLVLRFRLWVHSGPKPSDDWTAKLWTALHAPAAALPCP